jgi:octaprenyl-diphosphate synthase
MQDLKQITKSLHSDLERLNIFLKKATSTDVPLINNLSSHMIESGGKRIRPIILMLFSSYLIIQKMLLKLELF